MSGKPLSKAGVQAARAEEIDFANKYRVWDLVPIQEAYDVTGQAPLSSRWIDLNTGDVGRPCYRSRLVIQEIRTSDIEAILGSGLGQPGTSAAAGRR